MEVADIVAGCAKQDRRLRFVQAQHVDDDIFGVRRRDGNALIGDIAMAAILTHGRDPQCIALIALGERDDRLWQRCRKQQRAALVRCRVENFLKVFAKAHVEHFVRFVEHRDAQRRQVERAALQVIAQPSWRADDDMRAMGQRAAFLGRVHPADARGDPRTGLGIKPHQFAADLQRQFARWRNNQRLRGDPVGQAVVADQFTRHRQPECDRFAGPGLRRHQQIAPGGLCGGNGVLHRGKRFIAARGKRFGERRRKVGQCHHRPDWQAAKQQRSVRPLRQTSKARPMRPLRGSVKVRRSMHASRWWPNA